MKNKLLYLLVLSSSIILAVTSCKKAPLTNGKIITRTVEVGHFDTLYVYDNINVTLVNSDTFKIEITTGENLIDNIIAESIDNALFLKNENTLNWLRSYDIPIEAKIYYKSEIECIIYRSVGDINTEDYIMNDSTSRFELRVIDGSGDINLKINCKYFYLISSFGTNRITVEGESKNTFIHHKGIGQINTKALRSEIIELYNYSTNNIFIQCEKKLNAKIYDYGNVYYKGHPEIISYISPNAQGKLMQD